MRPARQISIEHFQGHPPKMARPKICVLMGLQQQRLASHHWTKCRCGWVHKEFFSVSDSDSMTCSAYGASKLPSYLGKVSHDPTKLIQICCGRSSVSGHHWRIKARGFDMAHLTTKNPQLYAVIVCHHGIHIVKMYLLIEATFFSYALVSSPPYFALRLL